MTTLWMLVIVYTKSGVVIGDDYSRFKTAETCYQVEGWVNDHPSFLMDHHETIRRANCEKVRADGSIE